MAFYFSGTTRAESRFVYTALLCAKKRATSRGGLFLLLAFYFLPPRAGWADCRAVAGVAVDDLACFIMFW